MRNFQWNIFYRQFWIVVLIFKFKSAQIFLCKNSKLVIEFICTLLYMFRILWFQSKIFHIPGLCYKVFFKKRKFSVFGKSYHKNLHFAWIIDTLCPLSNTELQWYPPLDILVLYILFSWKCHCPSAGDLFVLFTLRLASCNDALKVQGLCLWMHLL